MTNVLLEYMKNRFKAGASSPKKNLSKLGPVVTISREFGCPAKRLAGMLTSALNRIEIENYSKDRWKWIGKEILEESAKELNLKSNIVRDVATTKEKGIVDDIVLSLSHRFYPGDHKIKNTIGEVVRSFAEKGHYIIIGRGGVSIARDIPHSLHIKLQAPLEWRINDVSKRHMIPLIDAEKKIKEIDRQRKMIREHFEGKKINDSVFDVVFNYMTLKEEDIIASILKMMELKNMF